MSRSNRVPSAAPVTTGLLLALVLTGCAGGGQDAAGVCASESFAAPARVAAGGSVAVSGEYYVCYEDPSVDGPQQVEVRLTQADREYELGQVTTDAEGRFTVTVRVPDGLHGLARLVVTGSQTHEQALTIE